MSKNLKKHKETLHYLSKARPSIVKTFIKTADNGLINAICECCVNVLKGNVPITKVQKNRLRKYKNELRSLVKKKTSQKKKKNIIQKGGFIPALLGPIIGVVSSLLGNLRN